MELKSPLVTADTVKAAAEALSSTGRKVSVRAVIAELGGGSPNAVSAHLKSWRAEQPVTANATPAMVDPRILQILREQISGAEEKAQTSARDRVAEVEEDNAAIAEEVVRLQGELLQRQAALEAVRVECDKAIAAAVEQAEKARAEASAQVEAARADVARERDEARSTRDELAVAIARLEEVPALRAEIEALSTALEAERGARTVAERDTAVASAKLAGAQRAGEIADANVGELKKVLAKVDADLSALREQLADERTARATSEKSAAVAIAERDAALSAATDARDRLAKLEGK